MKNIVWLASYPRSGNTWFRILLENLFSDNNKPVNINELKVATIASSRKLFDEYTGISSSDLAPDEVRILRPLVYKAFSESSKEILFLKTHDAWSLNIENKPIFSPEVTKGVIYLIRNPFDVAISIANQSGQSVKNVIRDMTNSRFGLCDSSEKLFIQLDQQLSTWKDHVDSWTKRSHLPIHIVKYEDLLTNTNKTFTEALDFLNIDHNKYNIQQAIKNSTYEVVKSQEEKFGFKERQIQSNSFFYQGSSYNMKVQLDQNDLSLLLESCKRTLIEFDYDIN